MSITTFYSISICLGFGYIAALLYFGAYFYTRNRGKKLTNAICGVGSLCYFAFAFEITKAVFTYLPTTRESRGAFILIWTLMGLVGLGYVIYYRANKKG